MIKDGKRPVCAAHFGRASVAVLLAAVTTVGVAGAQTATFEEPRERRASEVLSPEMLKGAHHRVRDVVVADGYMYRFAVDSDYGAFEVTGMGALQKLLGEIRGITALREIKKTKVFTAALKDSATGSFRFAKSLITNPADTLSGMPKGAYKFLEETGTGVTSERDPSDDPAYKKVLLMSARKREFAAQLGLDPYSGNAVLQKDLNSVAWTAAIGNLTVSAALMPVGGPAGAVVSVTRWGTALNDQLKNEPASRLRIINEGKLAAMGIPKELAKQFLDHKAFSPRHDTILVEALSRVEGARGREQFLSLALLAEDETDANFFTAMAQIMRGYHESVTPIMEMAVVGGRLVVAQGQNGRALVPLPMDNVLWTAAADARSREVKAAYRAATFNGQFDLWLTGTVSPTAKQRFAERGMTVTEAVGKRVEIID